MSDLKPCPFCGGKAEVRLKDGSWGYTPDRVWVGCDRCEFYFKEAVDDVYPHTKRYPSVAEGTRIVAEKWNTRKGEGNNG